MVPDCQLDKKLRDLEKKVELYKKQDGSQRTEVLAAPCCARMLGPTVVIPPLSATHPFSKQIAALKEKGKEADKEVARTAAELRQAKAELARVSRGGMLAVINRLFISCFLFVFLARYVNQLYWLFARALLQLGTAAQEAAAAVERSVALEHELKGLKKEYQKMGEVRLELHNRLMDRICRPSGRCGASTTTRSKT